MATDDDLIYHYCGLKGLQGIVENHSIWLTSLFYMNDNMEHFWFRDKAAGFVRQRINMLGPSSLLDDPTDDVARRRFYYEGLVQSVSDKSFADVFCASFSRESDDLSQWRGYGDDGYGFAIGFDPSALWDKSHGGEHGINLLQVSYDEQQQSRSLLDIFERNAGHLDSDPLHTMTERDVPRAAFSFRNYVWVAAAYCKNPAFHGEREIRLVYHAQIERDDNGTILRMPANRPSELLHRQNGRTLVPYFSYPIDPTTNPIRKIMFGPQNTAPEQEHAVRTWLPLHGFHNVVLTHSLASYRKGPL